MTVANPSGRDQVNSGNASTIDTVLAGAVTIESIDAAEVLAARSALAAAAT